MLKAIKMISEAKQVKLKVRTTDKIKISLLKEVEYKSWEVKTSKATKCSGVGEH